MGVKIPSSKRTLEVSQLQCDAPPWSHLVWVRRQQDRDLTAGNFALLWHLLASFIDLTSCFADGTQARRQCCEVKP